MRSVVLGIALGLLASAAARAEQPLDRSALPIPEPQYPPISEIDASKVKAPTIFEVKAPQGAPNVIVILLDNFGYAGSTTFGGVMNLSVANYRQAAAGS